MMFFYKVTFAHHDCCIPSGVLGELNNFEAKVVKIVDGDTITALDAQNTTIKIRMYGIDAPESKQAFGQKQNRP